MRLALNYWRSAHRAHVNISAQQSSRHNRSCTTCRSKAVLAVRLVYPDSDRRRIRCAFLRSSVIASPTRKFTTRPLLRVARHFAKRSRYRGNQASRSHQLDANHGTTRRTPNLQSHTAARPIFRGSILGDALTRSSNPIHWFSGINAISSVTSLRHWQNSHCISGRVQS